VDSKKCRGTNDSLLNFGNEYFQSRRFSIKQSKNKPLYGPLLNAAIAKLWIRASVGK
jgi:hypothetical protein